VDLVFESWDAKAVTLRGTSRVVAGDSYELRIVCPEGLEPVASSAFTFVRDGRILRATWNPTRTSDMDWSVAFQQGKAFLSYQ